MKRSVTVNINKALFVLNPSSGVPPINFIVSKDLEHRKSELSCFKTLTKEDTGPIIRKHFDKHEVFIAAEETERSTLFTVWRQPDLARGAADPSVQTAGRTAGPRLADYLELLKAKSYLLKLLGDDGHDVRRRGAGGARCQRIWCGSGGWAWRRRI